MSQYHPLATQLNETIETHHSVLYSALSQRGKHIFFPFSGILGQTAEAKGKKWNATIGIALEEDGSPMRLQCIDSHTDLAPEDEYTYASSFGKSELRELWRKMLYVKNPSLQAEVSVPVVACGLTHALSVAMYLFIDPDESLIVPDLYWGNYNLMFKYVYGAQFQTFSTFENSGFSVRSLRESLSGSVGKKVVLLNFPNNPSGYTPTKEEAGEIVSVIKERAEAGDTLVVLLDDAYFGLVYEDGVYDESLFAPLVDLHERVIVVKIDGATKEDYVWGYRIGFITCAGKGMNAQVLGALEAKLAGVVRATVSNVSHMSQSILIQAYKTTDYEAQKREKYALLKARYEKVQEVLREPKYKEVFTALPYNSGYFMCVKLREGLDAEALRTQLLKEYDTGVIAIGDMFRIAYSSLPIADIPSLFENLYSACTSSLRSS
ncbi:aspartate aminotransferase [Candidatus Peregrinibacteria bacterium CG10_big_fil_rev_8_21_14_0_10_49_24]|nr:MAG: aspartate aminotransferase [Candidatus Peregrinibacteria bacterium CG11_big_fil_rev_8_21_14_0_20_49_14]PIR51195.1 MAG: aspartate aminotransferase [Candidatus Peregrinibacteria bacterium CG10_big_fil_rev_8_21_14_0_10_49_24]PJA67234.1 MAG: aspartate aminotransferase [Candidatus Peregrinibacteria bacterium CG_4_9_14_3_um_filter_49_12]